MTEKDFPKNLAALKERPKELFVLGNFPRGRFIALVGTRRPSDGAETLCKRLVESLAETSAVIVSGLADGIDSFCHRAALDFSLPTIAILGQGLLAPIPGKRRELAEEILANGGALVSEYPGDTPGFKNHYPARNRIIAGLSEVIVIVESPSKGGSLITAHFALRFGRKLLSLPGDFQKRNAQGPLGLLRNGLASPIYFPEDLRGICGFPIEKSKESRLKLVDLFALSKETLRFYKKNAGFDRTLAELSTSSGLSTASLFSILTELELAGLVHSPNGFRYHFEKGDF